MDLEDSPRNDTQAEIPLSKCFIQLLLAGYRTEDFFDEWLIGKKTLLVGRYYSGVIFLRRLVFIPSKVAASAILLSAVINSGEPSSMAVAI